MQLRVDGHLTDGSDALIVCAGFDPLLAVRPGLLGLIRRIWRAGRQVGAIDTGAFVLAEAGILGRETLTLHWEAADEFRRRYPRIPVSTELYERHARLFTCAGGTAAMDMMLDGIAQHHGIALANAVSDQLIHDSIRPPSAPQRVTLAEQASTCGMAVQRLVEAMERSLGQAVPLAEILVSEGISRRNAERMFSARMKTTPGRFLRELRLRHAVELMRNARMPVQEAALAAGFSSQPVFSRACRQQFGMSPREILAGPGLPPHHERLQVLALATA
jgi:AraC family carnitine catabolism transcriptional activator